MLSLADLAIKGHAEAMRGLEELVHDERPLTEQLIREMHQGCWATSTTRRDTPPA